MNTTNYFPQNGIKATVDQKASILVYRGRKDQVPTNEIDTVIIQKGSGFGIVSLARERRVYIKVLSEKDGVVTGTYECVDEDKTWTETEVKCYVKRSISPSNTIDWPFTPKSTYEIVDVCNKLANGGKRVIVAGLDMDYEGNPFGPMPNLMAIAEFVTKVHAICTKTGNLANYSHRISKSKDLVLLGEREEYEPLSRLAFKENFNK